MCFKCNDKQFGNPTCDETAGCEYISQISKVKCKKCRDGYFESIEGKCYPCSYYIKNCGKCHYKNNNNTQPLICDNCIDDIYTLNTEKNLCQLNDCEEYPDISPGCIICKDKLNEYKSNNKCQRCKYGYFKTKEEKCIYCSSEQKGGPGCYECGYETNDKGVETDKIICKECFSDINVKTISYEDYTYYNPDFAQYSYSYSYSYYDVFEDPSKISPLLSKEGKCYDCQIQFGGTCEECRLIKNEKGIETLKCVSCSYGFFLTSEGNCISISSILQFQRIPNCHTYIFSSGAVKFEIAHMENNNDNFLLNIYDQTNNDIVFKAINNNGLGEYEKKCLICENGYFINKEGNCEELNYDKCSFNNVFNNFDKLSAVCYNFCNGNSQKSNNVIIKMKLKDKTLEIYDLFYIYYLYSYSSYLSRINIFFDFFKGSDKIKTCLKNTGEGDAYAPKNLENCQQAYYFPENDTYSCDICITGYKLNKTKQICVKDDDNQCKIENLGTEKYPRYNCINNFYSSSYVLVRNENKDVQYSSPYDELYGCVEAEENTTYLKSKYNCTKCSYKFLPYYSKFYERIICQNIENPIIKERTINPEYYDRSQDKVKAVNGICERENLFTPNGTFCYKCDDEKIGIVGCKGGCNFSNKTNDPLKCVGGCRKGYIEYSEGLCRECQEINSGCHECHYENVEKDYVGIKRERKFVCDYCQPGYMKSSSGQCISYHNLGLDNCNRIEVDPKNNSKR